MRDRPNRPWGRSKLLFSGYRGSLCGDKLAGAWSLTPSTAEVKNEWSYNSTAPKYLTGTHRDSFTLTKNCPTTQLHSWQYGPLEWISLTSWRTKLYQFSCHFIKDIPFPHYKCQLRGAVCGNVRFSCQQPHETCKYAVGNLHSLFFFITFSRLISTFRPLICALECWSVSCVHFIGQFHVGMYHH